MIFWLSSSVVSTFIVGWLIIGWFVITLFPVIVWCIDSCSNWSMILYIWIFTFIEYFTFSRLNACWSCWLVMANWLVIYWLVMVNFLFRAIVVCHAMLRFRVKRTRIKGVLREWTLR